MASEAKTLHSGFGWGFQLFSVKSWVMQVHKRSQEYLTADSSPPVQHVWQLCLWSLQMFGWIRNQLDSQSWPLNCQNGNAFPPSQGRPNTYPQSSFATLDSQNNSFETCKTLLSLWNYPNQTPVVGCTKQDINHSPGTTRITVKWIAKEYGLLGWSFGNSSRCCSCALQVHVTIAILQELSGFENYTANWFQPPFKSIQQFVNILCGKAPCSTCSLQVLKCDVQLIQKYRKPEQFNRTEEQPSTMLKAAVLLQ